MTCRYSNGKSAKFENGRFLSKTSSTFFDICAEQQSLIAFANNKRVTVWQKNEISIEVFQN